MENDIIKAYLMTGKYNYDEIMFYLKKVKQNKINIDELIPLIEIHFENIQNIAMNFYNILNSNINKEYRKIMAYRALPYKNGYNLFIDVELFILLDKKLKRIYNFKDSLKYEYYILYLLRDKNINRELINEFFNLYNVSFQYFYDDPKIFGYNSNLYDEYMLEHQFYDLYYYLYDYEHYSTIVGLYAEYLEYLKLLNNKEELIWTSKECGDGFGYDFLLYDKEKDISKCYEVKGTMYKKNMDKFKLSSNEFNKYVNFNESYNENKTMDQIDNLLIVPKNIKEEHDYFYSQFYKKDFMKNSNGHIKKVYRIDNQLRIV